MLLTSSNKLNKLIPFSLVLLLIASEHWHLATYRPKHFGGRGAFYPFAVQSAVGICGGRCYQTKTTAYTTQIANRSFYLPGT